MKKSALILMVLILIIPSISLATQGTCSYHGGVNCSAGADWDGSAICEDGWRDSSESYYSVSKCSNYKPTCTAEEYNNLVKKSGIKNIQAEINSLEEQYNAKEAEMNKQIADITGSPYGTMDFLNNQIAAIKRKVSVELNSLALKINSNIDRINILKKDIEIDCEYLGRQRMNEEYDEKIEYMKNLLKSQSLPSSQKESSLESTCPSGSSLGKDNMCYCKDGYVWNKNNKCISKNQAYQEVCVNSFGSKSSWNGVINKDDTLQCQCSEGYVMGKNNKCITMASWCTETYGENIKPEGGNCVCDNSFYFDESLQKCVKDTTIFNDEQGVNYSTKKEVKWYKRLFNWFF